MTVNAGTPCYCLIYNEDSFPGIQGLVFPHLLQLETAQDLFLLGLVIFGTGLYFPRGSCPIFLFGFLLKNKKGS